MDSPKLHQVKSWFIRQTPVISNLPATIGVSELSTGEIFDVGSSGNRYTAVWNPAIASNYFNFNEINGKVSVKPGVVFLLKGVTFTLTVTAYLNNVASVPQTLTVQYDQAANNDPPAFSSDFLYLVTDKNKANDVLIDSLTAQVNDPNGIRDRLTFQLLPSRDSDYFRVDPATGALSMTRYYNSILLAKVVTLRVRVSDQTGSSDDMNVVVVFEDPTELPPIPNLPATLSIPESISPETYIYDLGQPLGEAAQVTYTVSQSPSTPPDLFVVEGGRIKTAPNRNIDFETLGANKAFTLTIQAVGTGAVTLSTPPSNLTINVIDINERPVFTSDSYRFQATDLRAGGIITNSFLNSVSDPDLNNQLSFYLVVSQYSSHFKMDERTGQLSFRSDYPIGQLPQQVPLQVLVRDEGFLYSKANITVTMSANRPPTFLNLPATIRPLTSVTSGVVVYNVEARDVDGDVLRFSFQDSFGFPANLFSIDSNTGEVRLRQTGSLVNLQQAPVRLVVQVSDGRQSVQDLLTVDVTRTSTNQSPQFNQTVYPIRAIRAPAGSVVYSDLSTLAFDPDVGDRLTYTLDSSNANQYFTLDPNTGVLRLSQLGPNVPSDVVLMVRVTDSSGRSDMAYLVVAFLTVSPPPSSNQPPVFTNLPSNAVIYRQFYSPNTPFFTVRATDPDVSDVLTFRLTSPSNLFRIDASSGGVYLRTNLNINTGRQDIEISVSDGVNTDTKMLTVLFF